MYREGLLILSIILIIIGVVLPYLPVDGLNTVGSIIFWIGVILLIIWIVLFAFDTIKARS